MTEVMLEFRANCPISILKELENRGFIIFELEPLIKKVYECNLDDLGDFKPDHRFRAIYNGSKEPSKLLGDLLNDCPSLIKMKTIYRPQ